MNGRTARTAAWVLYDLANTVYAATVTFVFTPFAAARLGGDAGIGLAQGISMVCAGLCVPVLGALADHTTRTRGYLAVATLVCVAAMAGFGVELGAAWLLGCFAVANLAYNLALLFYNSLLPAVASGGSAGRISGLGVGVGYGGTILVLVVLLNLPVGDAPRFVVAAAMFLVAATPCLLLVADPRPPRAGSARAAMGAAVASLRRTLRELPRHRELRWFLLANFCLADVLNTAILFFARFTTETFRDAAEAGTLVLFGHHFTGAAGLTVFLTVMGVALNGLALGYGLLLGRWTDRAPLAVMRASALALFAALVGGTVFGGVDALGYLLTLVALGAFGLAGIWTAGRKVVVLLAPPAQVGEYFGLYGITVKLSVIGGVVYGLIAGAHGCKPAMLAQGVQLLLGVCFLLMVRLPDGRHADRAHG